MSLSKFTIADIKIDESKDSLISHSILNGLRLHTAPYLGPSETQPFCFYMAENPSRVIAGIYGAIRQYPQAKAAWVHQIWVEEAYRKQGLGSALLTHLNHFCYQKKCSAIQLEAYGFQNIAFFEKQGFQIKSTISNALLGKNKMFMGKKPSSDFIRPGALPILLDESENQEIKHIILEGVKCFNKPYLGEEKSQDFTLYLQEPSQSIIGGMTGKMHQSHAWVHVLWVDEAYRNQGIGTLLWEKLEDYLSRQSCPLILVGTFEISTKLFYEKMGCQCQGTVAQWLGGYDQHWMEKRLKAISKLDAKL
jgi:GNAT superfamily N-acetyltransferase